MELCEIALRSLCRKQFSGDRVYLDLPEGIDSIPEGTEIALCSYGPVGEPGIPDGWYGFFKGHPLLEGSWSNAAKAKGYSKYYPESGFIGVAAEEINWKSNICFWPTEEGKIYSVETAAKMYGQLPRWQRKRMQKAQLENRRKGRVFTDHPIEYYRGLEPWQLILALGTLIGTGLAFGL